MIPDDEVVRLCSRMWGSAKAANLDCPRAGGDATWAEVIAVAEELIASTLALHLRSPVQGKRAEIERRCALDQVARRASIYPTAYSRPLYVSDGFLGLALASEGALPPRRATKASSLPVPPCRREHVIPVAVHASGMRILRDPEANLPRIRRTFLAPICLISAGEDNELRRRQVKGHDAPFHPFSRYQGIATIRRTDTGTTLDAAAFTFRDHLRLMAGHPAYATGVPLFRGGSTVWRRRIAAFRAGEQMPC